MLQLQVKETGGAVGKKFCKWKRQGRVFVRLEGSTNGTPELQSASV